MTTYEQLDRYLGKFSSGELGLVLLLGRPGTGKCEGVKRAVSVPDGTADDARRPGGSPLYVEGHMQPFGLYRQLWEFWDRPIVLDDLDRLYADPDCVRLLKPLCNTVKEKRIHWLSNLTMNERHPPSSFVTSSNVILIANEWKSLNPNVRALEDRAIILHFDPTSEEVHRKVRKCMPSSAKSWPSARPFSVRHYRKGSQLRRAGLDDWRTSLLRMLIADAREACVLAVQRDPRFRSERERVKEFIAATRCSRATYFRLKSRLVVQR